MRIAKRVVAIALSLLILMMNAAQADVSFLVHSDGWNLDATPVDVLLSAEVTTHMPFDEERLAMLTPIIELLSLRLVTGEDAGRVTISMMDFPLLSLQYQENAVRMSCLPGITYTADGDPMSALLGGDISVDDAYDGFGLSPEGETLLSDGRILLEALPNVFEAQGKKTNKVMNIASYGRSAYLIDFTISANQVEMFKQELLDNCPEGWLKSILQNLTFSGKQTIRMYFTKENVLLRMEYNGTCGPEGDLRKVKLVYKGLHNSDVDKDYIELTSPAKKGKNKNTLDFERTVEMKKDGSRVLAGSFKYTVTADEITSIWSGEFLLTNAITDTSDVLGGEFTIQRKLNGAEKYEAITIAPELTISGTADSPLIGGFVTVTEKYAGKVTEHAKVSVDLKRAEPLEWDPNERVVDLSSMSEVELASVQADVSAAVASAIVVPLIVQLGPDAEFFFRDLPEDAIDMILDAASPAAQ